VCVCECVCVCVCVCARVRVRVCMNEYNLFHSKLLTFLVLVLVSNILPLPIALKALSIRGFSTDILPNPV
jgi:hypothetical protein